MVGVSFFWLLSRWYLIPNLRVLYIYCINLLTAFRSKSSSTKTVRLGDYHHLTPALLLREAVRWDFSLHGTAAPTVESLTSLPSCLYSILSLDSFVEIQLRSPSLLLLQWTYCPLHSAFARLLLLSFSMAFASLWLPDSSVLPDVSPMFFYFCFSRWFSSRSDHHCDRQCYC